MTSLQAELLKQLYVLEAQTRRGKYWKPKELGASRSSHHAATLRRLLSMELVERSPEDGPASYRISPAGREAWELFQDACNIPLVALSGGQTARNHVLEIRRLAA